MEAVIQLFISRKDAKAQSIDDGKVIEKTLCRNHYKAIDFK